MTDLIDLEFMDENPQIQLTPLDSPVIEMEFSKVLQGERGPPGGENFIWQQDISLIVWTIPHNMQRYPSVAVVDDLGNLLTSDIRYVDSNIVQVIHGAAFAGKAYLN